VATGSRWTDERLDDAFTELRGAIAELRADIREIRQELRELCRELYETRRCLLGMFATQVLGFIAIVVEIGVKG
jgi:hypothetical protein